VGRLESFLTVLFHPSSVVCFRFRFNRLVESKLCIHDNCLVVVSSCHALVTVLLVVVQKENDLDHESFLTVLFLSPSSFVCFCFRFNRLVESKLCIQDDCW